MVVDLFAGPGGWDLGARWLGLDPLGYELDPHACATREAAGMHTVPGDVTAAKVPDQIGGLIASPPCQAFSMAGKGAGRDEIGRLHDAIDAWAETGDPEWLDMGWDDDRTPLVLEPLRWLTANPDWLAFEQVPPVLELWQHIADHLTTAGWSAWAGILNSADYGVPQTRRRAFLIARRPGLPAVQPPLPTHAKHPEPSLFGPELRPWVTMADALGWTGSVDRRQQNADGSDVPPVPVDRPCPTLDGQVGGKWVLHHNANANGSQGKNATITDDIRRWVTERPATTIVGSFEPDIVAPPTYRQAGDGPRQNQPGAVKITEAEALVLQSFPPDWPLQGPKTARFLQIGNAVPPRLAMHVLAAATGLEVPADEMEGVA